MVEAQQGIKKHISIFLLAFLTCQFFPIQKKPPHTLSDYPHVVHQWCVTYKSLSLVTSKTFTLYPRVTLVPWEVFEEPMIKLIYFLIRFLLKQVIYFAHSITLK